MLHPEKKILIVIMLMLLVFTTILLLPPNLLAQSSPQQLAYQAYNRQKHVMHLYVGSADGSGEPYSIGLPFSHSYAWSPDGSQFAFTSFADGINVFGDIYVMDVDGSNLRNLTETLNDHTTFGGAAWSPDGTQIAFFGVTPEQGELWIVNAGGSSPVMVYSEPKAAPVPAWSPDGTHIAFTDATRNIILLNVTDLTTTQITATGDMISLAWSPDGTHLLVVRQSEMNTENEVFVMNADGTNEINLSNHPARDEHARWSPDGTQAVFTSERDGNDEIYRVDADGENLTNLTRNPANEDDTAWSPDGSQIAYSIVDADGQSSIWLMNADGSNQNRLAEGSTPIWRPAP